MFLQKTPENCHFYYKYQIFEKYHFWTHVIVGSYSMVDSEDVEKISEFFTM